MKQMNLVNVLKTTIVEQNQEGDNSSDVGQLEFGKMWYSQQYGDAVYFSDFDKKPNTFSSAVNLILTDKNTGDDFMFDPDELTTTKNGNTMYLKMRDMRVLYPSVAQKLMDQEHKYKNENLNVSVLKTKASGIPQLILDILKDVYPNNWGKISEPDCETLEGVIDIFPAMEGERWSILNFFDTNPGVIKILVEKYQDDDENADLVGFKEWLRENQEDLFGENSETLKALVKRNLQSFERGWKTEAETLDIIKRDNPSITDEDISQYCLGSILDRVSGIDFKINGKGYQTKPSSKMERLKSGAVRVQTYGMRDWYQRKKDIDYIIYSNGKHVAVFPNKNYKVSNDGKTVTHYDNMVKNSFI